MPRKRGITSLAAACVLVWASAANGDVGVAGDYQTHVPVVVPAFHGLAPDASLAYTSSGGAGWAGEGWTLAATSSITRSSSGGGMPRWDGSDRYAIDGSVLLPCLDAGDDVPVTESPSCAHRLPGLSAYTTRVESFTRVAFEPTGLGGRWRVWARDGRKSTYEPGIVTERGVHDWRLSRVEDAAGVNVVEYEWSRRTGDGATHTVYTPVLRAIRYSDVVIRFVSEPRPDPIVFATGGSIARSEERLRVIDQSVGGQRVRAYALRYDEGPGTGTRSFLREVQHFGSDATVEGTVVRGPTSAAPIELGHASSGDAGWSLRSSPTEAGWLDAWPAAGADESQWRSIDASSGWARSGSSTSWVSADLNADSRADFLRVTRSGEALSVRANVTQAGGGYARREVATAWTGSPSAQPMIGDVDGDGRSDLAVILDRPHSVPAIGVALTRDHGRLEPLPSRAVLEGETEWHLADVTGDGAADLIAIERAQSCGFGACECPSLSRDVLRVGVSRADGTWDFASRQIACWSLSEAAAVTVGDVNGDLKADVVAFEPRRFDLPNRGTARVFSAISDGTGRFQLRDHDTGQDWGPDAPGEDPGVVPIWQDVDADSRVDLVVFRHASKGVEASTLFGRGDGSWRPPVTRLTSLLPADMTRRQSRFPEFRRFLSRFVSGDFNGDGAADVAVVRKRAEPSATFVVERLASDRRGGWDTLRGRTAEAPEACPASSTRCDRADGTATAGDVDGDGRDDLMLAYPAGPFGGQVANGLAVDLSSRGPSAGDVLTGDVSGDGRPDMIYPITTAAGVEIRVLRRTPSGDHRPVQPFAVDVGSRPLVQRGWTVLDADGDRRADLVAVRSRRVTTLLARSEGTWKLVETPLFDVDGGGSWRPADVDSDGRDDLLRVLPGPDGRAAGVDTLLSQADGSWELDSRELDPSPPVGAGGWMPIDVNADARLDLVRVAFGGTTGTVHTLLRRGDGWERVSAQPWSQQGAALPEHLLSPHAGTDVLSWKALDLNGDGAVDLAHVSVTPAGAVYVGQLLSRGDGTWRFAGGLTGNWAVGGAVAGADAQDWLPADLDHDGRGDLVHAAVTGGRVRVQSAIATGDGRWEARDPSVFDDLGTTKPDSSSWRTMDIDATGDTDMLQLAEEGGALSMRRLNSSLPRPLVIRVSNGTGARTRITYGTSTTVDGPEVNDADCRLPPGVVTSVATAVVTHDQASDTTDAQALRWECPRWSARLRGLPGWRETTVAHDATAHRPAWTERTRRHVSEEGIVQPFLAELSGDEGVMRRTTWEHAALQSAPFRDLVRREERATCTPQRCATTTTTFAYDRHGNVAEREVRAAGSGQRSREEIRYAVNPERFIVSSPRRTSLIDPADGAPLSVTLTCYDGDSSSECERAPDRGLPTTTRQWDDRRRQWVSSHKSYDDWGNHLTSTDPLGHTSTTTFDPDVHRHPIRSCNALGHCIERSDFDAVSGAPRETRDPNGATSRARHDALGRPVSVTTAGGRTIETRYEEDSERGSTTEETVRLPGAGGYRAWTFRDGLGREYLAERAGLDGELRRRRETRFGDASELVVRHARWHDADAPARWETSDYDAAGRLAATRNADGSEERRSFALTDAADAAGEDMVAVTSSDESGRRRTDYSDGLETLVAVGEPGAPGTSVLTRHRYDALGRPTAIVDARGNATRFEWDSLGRLVSEHDLDRGTTGYRYDDAGNLTLRRDATGRALSFRYDAIGRRVAQRDEATRAESTWTYDEPGHGSAIGRLTSVRDPSASGCQDRRSRSLAYDISGNVTSDTRCVTGTELTVRTEYDALGRPTGITYPDGETVGYSYDAADQITEVSGYAGAFRHNADGRPTSATYANGTRHTWAYDEDRGWMTSQRVVGPTGRTLFDAAYEHGPDGLVTSAASRTNRTTQSYGYDQLRRLTSVGGDHAQRLRYDELGNITANSRVGTYAYRPASGQCSASCPGPHAVTRAGTTSFRYDPAGQLIRELRRGRTVRRLTWNSQGLPSTVETAAHGRTTMRYDADGERVRSSSKRGTTKYFGPLVDWSSKTGITKHVYAAGTLIASRTDARTTWYGLDRLGSPRVLMDRSGRVISRANHTAFGLGGSSSGAFGFAGQRPDRTTGLIYMHSRYYDARLGRMISPDSIVPDPGDPQALNRYSYAYNNPVAYTDPSGHVPIDPEARALLSLGTLGQWLDFARIAENYDQLGVRAFAVARMSRLRTGDQEIANRETIKNTERLRAQAHATAPGGTNAAQATGPVTTTNSAPAGPATSDGTSPSTGTSTPDEAEVLSGTATIEISGWGELLSPYGAIPADENGVPQPQTLEQAVWLKCGSDAACALAQSVDWAGVNTFLSTAGAGLLAMPLALVAPELMAATKTAQLMAATKTAQLMAITKTAGVWVGATIVVRVLPLPGVRVLFALVPGANRLMGGDPRMSGSPEQLEHSLRALGYSSGEIKIYPYIQMAKPLLWGPGLTMIGGG